MSPRRSAILGLLSLCFVFAIAGCGGGSKSGGGDDQPIVIGAAVAKTGIMSQFDEPVLQGAQVAIDQINRKGGVDGRKLKLVVADHKSNLDQVPQAALDVVDRGAKIVITTHDFDFGSPAARVAQDRGLLVLGGAGGMLYGRKGIGPLAFNLYPGNVTEGAVMAQFAHDQGYKRPYLLQDLSILYTKEVCKFFETQWREIGGGDLAGTATFQNDDKSFASQVDKVRRSNADSVIVCSYPPGGPAIIRQLRASGVDAPIVASGGGMDGTRWLNAVPHLSNYFDSIMASLAGDDPRKEVNELFAEIKRRTGDVPQLAAQALTGYSAIETVKLAVEKNGGSTDGQKLASTIEGFKNQDLLVGPVTYSADCHVPVGMPMQIRKIEDGKPSWFKTVDPKSVPKSIC